MEFLQSRSFLIDDLIDFSFDQSTMFGEFTSIFIFQSIEIIRRLVEQLSNALRRFRFRHLSRRIGRRSLIHRKTTTDHRSRRRCPTTFTNTMQTTIFNSLSLSIQRRSLTRKMMKQLLVGLTSLEGRGFPGVDQFVRCCIHVHRQVEEENALFPSEKDSRRKDARKVCSAIVVHTFHRRIPSRHNVDRREEVDRTPPMPVYRNNLWREEMNRHCLFAKCLSFLRQDLLVGLLVETFDEDLTLFVVLRRRSRLEKVFGMNSWMNVEDSIGWCSSFENGSRQLSIGQF